MATQARITYDLLGAETNIEYEGLPVCRDAWVGNERTEDFNMAKFPFDVTCKRCKKCIQEEMNKRYHADKEARLRAGLPGRGDYMYTEDIK